MRQDKLSTGVSKKENNRGFKIVDSLDKYLKSDSLFCYPGQKFYIGVANNLNFGLVMLNDSSFILYQKLKTKWVITDTIDFPLTYGHLLKL
jgi:hypothetical protein